MNSMQFAPRPWVAQAAACLCAVAFSAVQADEFPQPPNSERATDRPLSPAEVVQSARLPQGFRLEVFAAEPDVQNPIAITTDARGRLWVAENYTWSGANFNNYDTHLRDRIVVLADTDGDGRHDQRTVFWDKAQKLTSIEVGHGGVWALALPYLLFIPDADGDDVPDGPPQIVLDGLDDHAVGHTPANGLKWGPDGWLYARHGIQATSLIGPPEASQSQRVAINTGVWRYHPGRRQVEAVMHGMTNSWGFDYDALGEMFVINTVIGHLWHVVPGAHVERMYGADLDPHVYSLIPQTADHVHWATGEKWTDVRAELSDKTSAAGGGHAHIGLMIYQADNWPAEYRGRVYTLNLHGRRINSDLLEPQGAGLVAHHGADLCFLADPWFRGMELVTGADGGVYPADWSDTGECHDHDGVHRTSGRIYKLTHGTPPVPKAFDLRRETSMALSQRYGAPNTWWDRQIRVLWAERARRGDELADVAERLRSDRRFDATPELRVARFWGLEALGALDEPALTRALSDSQPALRAWAVRLLADRHQAADTGGEWAEPLVELARSPHCGGGTVPLYLAAALQRLPVSARWKLAGALVQHAALEDDRMYSRLVWYGIEPAVAREPERALALARDAQLPLVRRHLARRLAEELAARTDALDGLLALAAEAGDDALAGDLLGGLADGLRGWRQVPRPAGWSAAEARLARLDQEAARQALREMNLLFGEGRALDELKQVIADSQAEPATRQQALRTLLAARPEGLAPVLHRLLADRAVSCEAIRGLAQYDDPDSAARILQLWGTYAPDARAEAINTLAARARDAAALLDAVAAGQIDRQEITALHARQMRALGDDALTQRLSAVWGEVRESPVDKRAHIAQLRTNLGDAPAHGGNPSAGRQLFQKTCANCHVLFGAGRKLGPDLTGSNRKNLDYLLENMVDPSASVGSAFRAVNFVLDDGRLVTGVVSESGPRTLTVQTADAALVIDRGTIAEEEPTGLSIMPDGLLQNLSLDQVRDLVSYLMADDQVPLPQAGEGAAAAGPAH